MANDLLTPSVIADAALANLYENAVMAQLVNRNYDGAFAGKVGDTVTIRKPTTFKAEDFDVADRGITIQDATESSVDVKLDKFKDVSFAVTSEELTLDIQDFNVQLLNPAMEALWQQIDVDLLSLVDDVTASVGSTGDAKILIDAGQKLNEAKVSATNRNVVAGAAETATWLKDPLFHEADKRGNTDGLREASIGRKFGFDTYMDQHVSDTDARAVAFHKDAFTLVTRPLSVPRGAQNAAVRNYNGFGLRVVYDYDVQKKRDVVSIDCLYGVKVLDADKAVLIEAGSSA